MWSSIDIEQDSKVQIRGLPVRGNLENIYSKANVRMCFPSRAKLDLRGSGTKDLAAIGWHSLGRVILFQVSINHPAILQSVSNLAAIDIGQRLRICCFRNELVKNIHLLKKGMSSHALVAFFVQSWQLS